MLGPAGKERDIDPEKRENRVGCRVLTASFTYDTVRSEEDDPVAEETSVRLEGDYLRREKRIDRGETHRLRDQRTPVGGSRPLGREE